MEQIEGEFKYKHSLTIWPVRQLEPVSASVATIQLLGQIYEGWGPFRAAAKKKAPINPLTKQLMDLIFLCLWYNSLNTGLL